MRREEQLMALVVKLRKEAHHSARLLLCARANITNPRLKRSFQTRCLSGESPSVCRRLWALYCSRKETTILPSASVRLKALKRRHETSTFTAALLEDAKRVVHQTLRSEVFIFTLQEGKKMSSSKTLKCLWHKNFLINMKEFLQR